MTETAATESWDERLASYLEDLLDTQGELLAFLRRRRETMVGGDVAATATLNDREATLAKQLAALHERRTNLLNEAGVATSLEEAARLRSGAGSPSEAWSNARRNVGLLRHECVVNWLLTQRTLLHLSQLLHRVFGGDATYSSAGKRTRGSGGALVDHQA